jgi:hypothetical protein
MVVVVVVVVAAVYSAGAAMVSLQTLVQISGALTVTLAIQ